MYTVLIVEDEPLIQSGICAMLENSEHELRICGIAFNGIQALELIQEQNPDLVLTDIRMPGMDGLTLMEECNRLFKQPPRFIVLTGYGEFSFAQQALRAGAVDYLVKLELTEENLLRSIQKACTRISGSQTPARSARQQDLVAEQFWIKLLNMFYPGSESLKRDMETARISMHEGTFCTVFFSLEQKDTAEDTELYAYALKLIRDIANRYFKAYVIPADQLNFTAILSSRISDTKTMETEVLTFTRTMIEMVKNYSGAALLASIGTVHKQISELGESYQNALHACKFRKNNEDFILYSGISPEQLFENNFNLQLFRQPLKDAIDALDGEEITRLLQELTEILKKGTRYLQVFDACSNLLYLLLNLLPDSEVILNNIYARDPLGYKRLYHCLTIDSLFDWLRQLYEQIGPQLIEQQNSHSHYLIASVKEYIRDNITMRFTLQEIAAKYKVNPNYLSSLFKKHTGVSFTYYVTLSKIKAAQELLQDQQPKLQDLSEHLGFDNPYYFSKVFKKITGVSPKEYAAGQVK